MNTIIQKHLKKGGRDIPPITKQFSEEFLHKHFKYILISIVHIAGRQAEAEQLAPVVTDQMQLKAEKPSHAAFTDPGYIFEYPVAFDTLVVADGYFSTVHEGYSGTLTEADGIEEKHHGDKHPMLNLYKTIVRQLFGKLFFASVPGCKRDRNA
jgi:hypothetical protein